MCLCILKGPNWDVSYREAREKCGSRGLNKDDEVWVVVGKDSYYERNPLIGDVSV